MNSTQLNELPAEIISLLFNAANQIPGKENAATAFNLAKTSKRLFSIASDTQIIKDCAARVEIYSKETMRDVFRNLYLPDSTGIIDRQCRLKNEIAIERLFHEFKYSCATLNKCYTDDNKPVSVLAQICKLTDPKNIKFSQQFLSLITRSHPEAQFFLEHLNDTIYPEHPYIHEYLSTLRQIDSQSNSGLKFGCRYSLSESSQLQTQDNLNAYFDFKKKNAFELAPAIVNHIIQTGLFDANINSLALLFQNNQKILAAIKSRILCTLVIETLDIQNHFSSESQEHHQFKLAYQQAVKIFHSEFFNWYQLYCEKNEDFFPNDLIARFHTQPQGRSEVLAIIESQIFLWGTHYIELLLLDMHAINHSNPGFKQAHEFWMRKTVENGVFDDLIVKSLTSPGYAGLVSSWDNYVQQLVDYKKGEGISIDYDNQFFSPELTDSFFERIAYCIQTYKVKEQPDLTPAMLKPGDIDLSIFNPIFQSRQITNRTILEGVKKIFNAKKPANPFIEKSLSQESIQFYLEIVQQENRLPAEFFEAIETVSNDLHQATLI